jgi:hypothetical protein
MSSRFIPTVERESVDLVYAEFHVAHDDPTDLSIGIDTWRYGTGLSLQQAVYSLAQRTSASSVQSHKPGRPLDPQYPRSFEQH